MKTFLHDRQDFGQLLALVADDRGVDPMLVEKDYWIMHCFWGLQAQGFQFELKGGTSVSKGFGVIHRVSEDIDIRIQPPHDLDVKMGRNQDKPAHIASRRAYYDEMAARIRIPDITHVERDTQFDDDKMRSGHLPDSLSTEAIRHGATNRRNPTLTEHAVHILPYRGLGTGKINGCTSAKRPQAFSTCLPTARTRRGVDCDDHTGQTQ